MTRPRSNADRGSSRREVVSIEPVPDWVRRVGYGSFDLRNVTVRTAELVSDTLITEQATPSYPRVLVFEADGRTITVEVGSLDGDVTLAVRLDPPDEATVEVQPLHGPAQLLRPAGSGFVMCDRTERGPMVLLVRWADRPDEATRTRWVQV